MVRDPAVFRVTENVLVPEAREDAAGRIAAASLEVMETDPANEVAVLLNASFAITVALNDVPAVAEPGTSVKASWVAEPALTMMAAVADVSPVAAAVMVVEAAVFRVKEGEFCPATSAAEAGGVAAASLVEKLTEFVAVVTRLLFASWASTVVLNAVPAVAEEGADLKTSFVAAPGLTVIAPEVTE